MVDVLTLGVGIALCVLALAVRFYPWHDTRRRQRARLAAWVAWGALFGLLALSFYLSHAHGHVVPIWRIALLSPVGVMITERCEK